MAGLIYRLGYLGLILVTLLAICFYSYNRYMVNTRIEETHSTVMEINAQIQDFSKVIELEQCRSISIRTCLVTNPKIDCLLVSQTVCENTRL